MDDTALQSRNSGADALLLKTSWMIVSEEQQEIRKNAESNTGSNDLLDFIWPPAPITASGCAAHWFFPKNMYNRRMKSEIKLLNLLNPLFYISETMSDAFVNPINIEKLFCYEIANPAALEFEPDRNFFPGTLIFSGRTAGNDKTGSPVPALKPGKYLFTQVREILEKDEIIDLIIDVQQEGLWQRLIPEKIYFIRYVYEDGCPVTQIFRPYSEKEL